MHLITGTPYAVPRDTFNDLTLTRQFAIHRECAKEAEAYRRSTRDPSAPVFLLAPEYTYCAHPRDINGDVTHRFLSNDLKKKVLKTMRNLSENYSHVVFIFSISWLKRQPASDGTTEGRNTTYVYYKGRKIFSQHKDGDAGELLPGDQSDGVRYRAYGSPASAAKVQRQPVDGVFMVDGHRFGIETCCDFGCRLPFSLADENGPGKHTKKLAGQFLISSTLDHTQTAKDSKKFDIEVFQSDYFFHADGRKDLWEPPAWASDHFSKHLMGGFKVKTDPKSNERVLKPISQGPRGNRAPELSHYSVGREPHLLSHATLLKPTRFGRNHVRPKPVVSPSPSLFQSLAAGFRNWMWGASS